MGLFNIFKKKEVPQAKDVAAAIFMAAEKRANDFHQIKLKHNFPECVLSCNFHRAIIALHYSITKCFIMTESQKYQDEFQKYFIKFDSELAYECSSQIAYFTKFYEQVEDVFRSGRKPFQVQIGKIFSNACNGNHLSLSQCDYSLTQYGSSEFIKYYEVLTNIFGHE